MYWSEQMSDSFTNQKAFSKTELRHVSQKNMSTLLSSVCLVLSSPSIFDFWNNKEKVSKYLQQDLVAHYQLGQKNTVYLEMIYLGVQCMYFHAKPYKISVS